MPVRYSTYLMIFFAFVAPSFVTVSSVSLEKGKHVIWHQRAELTWDDFEEVSHLDEPGARAFSFVRIRSHQGFVADSLEIEVSCLFDRTRSKVQRGFQTEELLRHEQGHFDIGEIWTRKLRKAYAQLPFTRENFEAENGQVVIEAIYDNIWNKMRQMQEDYDESTNHGRNEHAQLDWNQKIRKELAALKIFSR